MRYLPYILPGVDPLEHLAFENALLDNAPDSGTGVPSSACGEEAGDASRGDAVPGDAVVALFYVNSPSVIIGRNQNPWREVAEGSAFPVWRRTSGGGTVYHDLGNLNWALVTPRNHHDQEAELAAIARGLCRCGVAVEPGPRGGIFCVSGTAAGKKVSGTARRFGAAKVLHHGTVLVGADIDALRGCLGGMETFDDRSVASVPASPVNLSVLRAGLSLESVVDALAEELGLASATPPPSGLVDPAAIAAWKLKLLAAEWIFGETPPFAVRVDGAEAPLVLRIRGGRVESARFDSFAAPTKAESLVGLPFSASLMKEAKRIAGV